jgi:hypothetical protein
VAGPDEHGKMLGISWPAEELLAFEEEICPLQVGRWLVIFCLAFGVDYLVSVAESILTGQSPNFCTQY